MDSKLIIIGSGPAGFTAAIYAARANLEPVLFEGFLSGGIPGGQLMTTTIIENYPGFPEGINGPELMQLMRNQAIKCGTKIISEDVLSVNLKERPFLVEGKRTKLKSQALIIATGATAKRLNIKGAGDHEFWQKGVSSCAVCDGALPMFRDKDLIVIGGGDSAVEEALFLTRFASKVYLVHRRDELRASKIMCERAKENPKIEILWSHVVSEIRGDTVVRSVILQDVKTNKTFEKKCAGVFFAIGHTPNTGFLQNQLALDQTGYIITEPNGSKTNLEGVFAAGDVQDPVFRQAITAAGSGCMAALQAERWLANQK